MTRILGTVFAALLGLAFGSFLNVCLSRWPEGESVVTPRSHCRNCGRVLAWWENVPLVSWLALRGRCRGCGASISWRYVIVEAAVGGLWALVAWRSLPSFDPSFLPGGVVANYQAFVTYQAFVCLCSLFILWLLVALAVLDAEHLWLPDWLTIPGIILGFFATVLGGRLAHWMLIHLALPSMEGNTALSTALDIVAAAGLILLIRWIYWLVRRREGIGLGDAKLMALLAAWLGLPGALLSFGIGVVLGALTGLVVILIGRRRGNDGLGLLKLPLGTFLCISGIVSALWGQQIIAAYVRWAGF